MNENFANLMDLLELRPKVSIFMTCKLCGRLKAKPVCYGKGGS
jgi:hypothetical protein